MIYDLPTAMLVNKINRREISTICSMDVSQEDTILALSYENARVELMDLMKAKTDIDEFAVDQTGTGAGKYILASYKTKQSVVFCMKFSYENLLLAVSLFCPETK